jgi:hypothetical protein
VITGMPIVQSGRAADMKASNEQDNKAGRIGRTFFSLENRRVNEGASNLQCLEIHHQVPLPHLLHLGISRFAA